MRMREKAVLACIIVTASLVLAPAALAATSFTITAPAGTGSYAQCSTIPVSWTVSTPVATGQFGFWVASPTGALYSESTCTPSGKSSYTYQLRANAPVGAGYRVMMRYRASSSTAWEAPVYSPGSFAVTPPVTLPFETLVHSHWGDAVVTGREFPFGFWVFHPDPNALVSSARLVLTSTSNKPVTYSAAIGLGKYVIETQWTFEDTPPPNTFVWKVALPAGTYRWHVLVTVNGVSNTMWDEGTLKVTRR